jgi:hypothetical protein
VPLPASEPEIAETVATCTPTGNGLDLELTLGTCLPPCERLVLRGRIGGGELMRLLVPVSTAYESRGGHGYLLWFMDQLRFALHAEVVLEVASRPDAEKAPWLPEPLVVGA